MPTYEDKDNVKIYSPSSSAPDTWRVKWKPLGRNQKWRFASFSGKTAKAAALDKARQVRRSLKLGEEGEVFRVSKREMGWVEQLRQLEDPEFWLNELAVRTKRAVKGITVAEACDRFSAEYENSVHHAAETRKDALRLSAAIKRTLGAKYLSAVTPQVVEAWRDELPGGKRYRKNCHAKLSQIFRRCAVWGWVAEGHNPSAKVPGLKIASKEAECWDLEDWRASLFFYAVRAGHWPCAKKRLSFLALCGFAGMRVSEVCGVLGERSGLLAGDVCLEERYIRVRPEVAAKLGESRYIEFVAKPANGLSEALADMLWSSLTNWLTLPEDPQEPVCARWSQEACSKELKDAGCVNEWVSNGMRHSWISSMLALGVSREWVAALAGNSPEVIRKAYRKPLREDEALSWFTLLSPATIRPGQIAETRQCDVPESAYPRPAGPGSISLPGETPLPQQSA